jgi:hypothetical protein
LILDWPRWPAIAVVGGTEATAVDAGVVVVVEVPVSLVLTLQLLVETAGDFSMHFRAVCRAVSFEDFLSSMVRIYHIELLRRAWKALW